jgi:hypothetical protein
LRITRVKNGLLATFLFSKPPSNGAQIRTTWFYNNRIVGQKAKSRSEIVSTLLQSSRKLPGGYWRCTLGVKLKSGTWRTVKDARVLVE